MRERYRFYRCFFASCPIASKRTANIAFDFHMGRDNFGKGYQIAGMKRFLAAFQIF
jgi:hypothetical protein